MTEKSLAPIDQVRTELGKLESQFQAVLPPHVPVEKFIRVVITALQGNPGLLSFDRKTLFSSCMKCASDGLLPDGREAALVPFKNAVQYMPMVSGILKKIRNSGELASMNSEIVYEKDEIRYWVDDNGPHVLHEPVLFGYRGEPIGVYAVAVTKDKGTYIEPMSRDQVMDVRNISQAKNGPWDGPFEGEMWRKTAIRRLAKRLPMSTDLEQVISRDDEMFDFNPVQRRNEKVNRLQNAIKRAEQPLKSISNAQPDEIPTSAVEGAVKGNVVNPPVDTDPTFENFEPKRG